MGIKGIYGEIGPGDRVSLAKLSIEHFEKTGIPLRVAIDISIWNFQIQAGQGGTNPALRTLYYRLLRLLSVSVQPLFVFDGPHKPPVKRNKQTGRGGASIPDLMTKELLKLFGFAYHIAPGEAEAECALLQREGIVDAVLSEDVDTLMFGSRVTFRNWSSETTKAKVPTHVNVYDAAATKAGKSGLDREGMILVALMSGGDYKTEGIPGCGVKVACEAARAGFGKSLCRIPRADTAAYQEWRRNLAHEMATNESKHFRIKRKAQQIPEDFPDRKVLGYYTHPVVSSTVKVHRLRDQIVWEGEMDIQKLRHFAADAFEWRGKEGAKKFVRGLAPVLLVLKLRQRGGRRASGIDDLLLTKVNEMALVRSICGQRQHISTDGLPEMRVVYHPLEIVGIDLDEEPDEEIDDYGRDGLAPILEDDQIEAYASDDAAAPGDTPRKRGPSLYDPEVADKLWVAETLVKVGVPLTAEDYAESLRNPKKPIKHRATTQKAATKKTTKKTMQAAGGMRQGALDPFVEVSEKGTSNTAKTLSQHTEDLETVKETLPSSFSTSILDSPKSPEPTAITKARTRKTVITQQRSKTRQNPWDMGQSTSQPIAAITKPSRTRRAATPTKLIESYDLNKSPGSSPVPTPLSSARGSQKGRPKSAAARTTLSISQSSSGKRTVSITKPSYQQKAPSPIKTFQTYSISPSPEPSSSPIPPVNKSSTPRMRRPSTPTLTIEAFKISTSTEVENGINQMPNPLSNPPSTSLSTNAKRYRRQSPIPFNDNNGDNDLPSHQVKKRSPTRLSQTLHTFSSSQMGSTRSPMTPKPANRKIDFSLHSSATKSSSSSNCSYNTAPSHIIDLSSPSPANSPREANFRANHSSPPRPSTSSSFSQPSNSPYRLNARTPMPSTDEILELASPEQQYLHSIGRSTPAPNLNSSTRIPGLSQIQRLNEDERGYLTGVGITTTRSQTNVDLDSDVEELVIEQVEIHSSEERQQHVLGKEKDYVICEKPLEIVEEIEQETKARKNESKKRYIMLRDSLPGFWREVGREELIEGRSRAWREEEVEIVDLTGE